MDAGVFVVVLLAALFHATWNAFVEADGDRLLFMGVLAVAFALGIGCFIASYILADGLGSRLVGSAYGCGATC